LGKQLRQLRQKKAYPANASLSVERPMNPSFAGKVVLITGGTSGIGRATAVAFAEQGANVVVAGRRVAEGAESVRLVEKTGGNGLFVRTDVAIEKEVEAMVARTVKYFGRLDFAFNNAGVSGETDSGKGIGTRTRSLTASSIRTSAASSLA
jgi:NAD(P)-dependent dehydrogenase (short-subunit alcohol dehydrogenase family)